MPETPTRPAPEWESGPSDPDLSPDELSDIEAFLRERAISPEQFEEAEKDRPPLSRRRRDPHYG